jgi:hypothetical protein
MMNPALIIAAAAVKKIGDDERTSAGRDIDAGALADKAVAEILDGDIGDDPAIIDLRVRR